MTNPGTRFRCPSCGFAIFNRRLSQCEACKADLPSDLLFSASELSWLQAEADRNEEIRKSMARQAQEREIAKQRKREAG